MDYAPGSESAAATGDYVGVESCIDLRNEEDFEAYVRDCERSYDRRRLLRTEADEEVVGGGWKKKEVDDFPPPISCLARTENQPSHMPWVMKRYYTEDGRLVIREEKVRHHEYFRAHRADGRLTLQLIPVDSSNVDDVEAVQLSNNNSNTNDTKVVIDGEEEEAWESIPPDADGKDCDTEVVNEKVKDEDEEAVARVMVTSVSMAALCITEGVKSGGMLTSASSSSLPGIGGGGGKNCYGFNSLRSSSASSLFHLQVPAIRPVIS